MVHSSMLRGKPATGPILSNARHHARDAFTPRKALVHTGSGNWKIANLCTKSSEQDGDAGTRRHGCQRAQEHSLMTSPKLLAIVATVLAIGRAAIAICAEQSRATARTSLPDCIRQYEADHNSVANFYRLPASDVALDRRERLNSAWLKRLQGMGFEGLDQSGKVDYLLLANELQGSLDGIARDRKRLAEMDRLIPFRKVIDAMEEGRWRAAPLDCRATATRLSDLADQVSRLREEVEKAHKARPTANPANKPARQEKRAGAKPEGNPLLAVSPALALRAGMAVRELQETLKRWFAYYQGYQPDFDWWIKKPYEEAGKRLDEYGKLLREEMAGQKGKEDDPLVGDPVGAEAIAAEIRFQFLPYSAEELIALGERELAWGEREMKEASRQMGLGDDWKAALAKVKADFVPPGQQDVLIERLGREATDFVKRRKLVVVPPLCEETWRMTMISPEGIKTMPYAAYGGQEMHVAYARDDMSQQDKLMVMRGNNRHFMRLVTPHELIPGHHLQLFYAARHDNYRRLFSTPFYVEGWALYWELRLWDLGWANAPEDRMGMLFWRMTRAARIIVSLKYHLGQMKPPELVDFLMTRVGHEKLGAASEVRRFVRASPLYQSGYMVGGLQFYALHKELVAAGKMTEEQFHGAVLKANTMPIELLRAELLRLPLSRDARPAWKFIGKL